MSRIDSHRILIVDDDRTFRLSTAELLRQEDYEVVGVASGQEAVDALGGIGST